MIWSRQLEQPAITKSAPVARMSSALKRPCSVFSFSKGPGQLPAPAPQQKDSMRLWGISRKFCMSMQ